MVAREALGENTVVSSSALKRSYREALSENVPTFFIHLSGTQELIQQRLNERKGISCHRRFCRASSPSSSRSPDENGVEVSIEGSGRHGGNVRLTRCKRVCAIRHPRNPAAGRLDRNPTAT